MSCELLDEGREHALDLLDPWGQGFMGWALEHADLPGQQKGVFQLAGRAPGDLEEPGPIGVRAPFGNPKAVQRNADSCPFKGSLPAPGQVRSLLRVRTSALKVWTR